jgi:hypothetical protein
MLDTCPCGRTFQHPGALKIHQRACNRNKKRLSTALAKAKEVWTCRKRRRIADPVDHNSNQANSQGPVGAGARESSNVNHDMELLEARFLFIGIYIFYL